MSMGNYVVVENGLVSNVVVWDGESNWTPPAGATTALVQDGECPVIGDSWPSSSSSDSA